MIKKTELNELANEIKELKEKFGLRWEDLAITYANWQTSSALDIGDEEISGDSFRKRITRSTNSEFLVGVRDALLLKYGKNKYNLPTTGAVPEEQLSELEGAFKSLSEL